jgi:hypothetical protein
MRTPIRFRCPPISITGACPARRYKHVYLIKTANRESTLLKRPFAR